MSNSSWDQFNKVFGNKMFRGDQPIVLDFPVIPFPSPSLADASHFGGVPFGKITQFHGPAGCLDKDTFIQYELTAPDGCRINHKGGTIERLYERFYRIDLKGKGKNSKAPEGTIFSAPSINDEGRIFQNRIVDVVKSGVKKCVVIKTNKREIIATLDHKFWVGNKFVPASELKVGDFTCVHNKTHHKTAGIKKKNDRVYLNVKIHPIAGKKDVFDPKTGNTYTYYRLARSRAVAEALENGLSPNEYVARLNAGEIEGLKFLSRKYHVHHLDEDCSNDSVDNLVVIDGKEHNRAHILERQSDLRYIAVEEEIVSIEDAGERETYDIRMESPYNNYVADGFVVHNSGKTFFAMMMVRELMRLDPEAEVVWFDAEQSFQDNWAEMLDIDMTRFRRTEENDGAEVFSMICGKPSKTGKGKGTPGILDMNKSGEMNVKLIVVDSIPALIPPAELNRGMEDMEMAAMARFLPKALRITVKKIAETNTALICINHAKEAIGDMVNKYTYPGGKGLQYMLSLVILFDTLQSKSATLFDEDEHKYGHRVDCTVEKTRGGPNKWKAKVWLDFKNGKIAKLGEEIALLGNAYGVVERPTTSKWKYGDIEVVGAEKFYEYLEENEEIAQQIVEECKEVKARGGDRKADLVDNTNSEEG